MYSFYICVIHSANPHSSKCSKHPVDCNCGRSEASVTQWKTSNESTSQYDRDRRGAERSHGQ